jgi:uncharacterized protein YndB with AHSA1/START domain
MQDKIEKEIFIRAPRARVWRALADKTEFGTWFQAALPAGEFAAGEHVKGRITYPGYEHLATDLDVVDVVPEEKLSFRWVPGVDDTIDVQTLVTFTLEDADGGTRLRVVETGFEALPEAIRAKAFRENDGGWAEQMLNIERHVTAG